MIRALGYEKAIVIGHDWGALAAYTAASQSPGMVTKLVTLAIPHPRAIKLNLSGLWRARHFIVFQFRGYARRFLSKAGFSGVDNIYKRWSPLWSPPPEETAFVKESFAREGYLDAALGYYWSFRQAQSGPQAAEFRSLFRTPLPMPSLCFVGDADGVLDLSVMEKAKAAFSGSYRHVVIPKTGHFLHRENPNAILAVLEPFLGSP